MCPNRQTDGEGITYSNLNLTLSQNCFLCTLLIQGVTKVQPDSTLDRGVTRFNRAGRLKIIFGQILENITYHTLVNITLCNMGI